MTISFIRIYQFIEQDRLEGGDLHTPTLDFIIQDTEGLSMVLIGVNMEQKDFCL